ncbi:M48 family metallopeptidase [Futiania mangrovi]|uniref:M48 family metallopeptidase n=1 Tax=Futiania mangrovi TaxID=2959716 RepID=A0A9J6PBA4_9PROT|nr:SprT family zinc-dependent metalloprotease [Futiania mangrovii]MCP1336461.1 M48 family metallopeptidase [Futiania mangrovii]
MEEKVLGIASGTETDVRVRRDPRARRLTLRLDARGEPVLTAPPGVGARRLQAFLDTHRDWLAAQIAARPAPVAFVPGAEIPVLGEPRVIRHDGPRGRPAELSGGALLVRGPADAVPRRVGAFLRALARDRLAAAANAHAAALEAPLNAIRLSDPKSRWGSCSSRGVLSFSWRLVFTPSAVLDYVAAHEVAHLHEMNHGPRFWALVERRVPDWKRHRDWLKREGAGLHRYGRTAGRNDGR